MIFDIFASVIMNVEWKIGRMYSGSGLWIGAGSTALASATFIFIGWLPGAGTGCQGQTIKTRCDEDNRLKTESIKSG